jgi:hypothetical protein
LLPTWFFDMRLKAIVVFSHLRSMGRMVTAVP